MPSLQDLVNAYTTDTATAASDAAGVAAAEAQQSADEATQATDTAALTAALAAAGPVAVVSADGTSVSIYAGEGSGGSGFTVTVYPTAANVPVPPAS